MLHGAITSYNVGGRGGRGGNFNNKTVNAAGLKPMGNSMKQIFVIDGPFLASFSLFSSFLLYNW